MTSWSPQQQAALGAVKRWLDAPPGSVSQFFYLAGYAGTGKTTLARALSEHAGGALACAYTGKAASVLTKKGMPASTIHRLIYTPAGEDTSHIDALRDEQATLERVPDPGPGLLDRLAAVTRALEQAQKAGGKPMFTLKSQDDCLVAHVPLVICDEVSMVPESLALDLLSFGTRILVLGDPAQLPPVKGTGYFTDRSPDFLLTEIHRQAAGSPILNLATIAREGRALPRGEWVTDQGTARVVPGISATQALAADQILVGTNAKRRAINRRHRELGGHLGASPFPRAGERLVCLANNYELGILNGTTWVSEEDAEWAEEDNLLRLGVTPSEGGDLLSLLAEPEIFLDAEERAPRWTDNAQFTFSYAMTVHKFQGSQADKVIGFLDWPSRESYRNWLYTLITRAAEDLTLVTG